MIELGKKTTMLLGVAAVGVAAYMLWKKSQKPKSFANAESKKKKKNRPLPPAQYGDVFQGDGIEY